MGRRIICVAIALGISSGDLRAATLFVTSTGTGNCGTWANACSLATALSLADPLTNDQIWVKAGTYSSAAPFDLKNGVKVIGGFAGTESSASQSNPGLNATILDGGGTHECAKNVNASPGAAPPLLRGFTLRNGRDTNDHGGALILENSNAHVVHSVFENNSASYLGGAVVIGGTGSPQFVNCTFRNNGQAATNPRDTVGGGAIYLREGTPLFVNCLFENNKGGDGGAVILQDGTSTFVNCTLVNNQATIGSGGAIHDDRGGVKLKNCILWGNTRLVDADGPGGQAPVAVIHNVETGGRGSTYATYSDFQGGWSSGAGNVNVDQLFTTGQHGAYYLSINSPCKNAGATGALPPDTVDLDWDGNTIEPIPKDLGNLPRVRLGAIDLGAYEIFDDTPPPGGGE